MAVLKHEGVKRRSGRYPWGSGENPYQSESFLSTVSRLQGQGLSEKQIAETLGMKTTEYAERKRIHIAEKRAADRSKAVKLFDKGYSKSAIGRELGGINESSVRALLDPVLHDRSQSLFNTADFLADAVRKKKYIDVGAGVEHHLAVSSGKLKAALLILKDNGYQIHYLNEPQIGTGEMTKLKVLVGPDTQWGETRANRHKISLPLDAYTEDGGRTYTPLEPFRHLSSDKIYIRYGDEGGSDRDGVIELRRGVPEIDLGNKRYAQVRVGVDGDKYMKGMAIHTKDIPDGYDVVYNTNKKRSDVKDKSDVFKPIDSDADPDAPFGGTTIRQTHYIDADGNRQLSALNRVGSKPGSGEEGSWDKWSKTLSSQVLSKQTPKLAKEQLDKALAQKREEYEDILRITNPTIRQKMLDDFADQADAATLHLKAAAMPRQVNRVLLPVPTLKDHEVYAPSFNDGDIVVLIRHPHGGTFEIPELTVNNKNRYGKDVIGNARDAVGINGKTAAKLSGADFDGDTVLVIPNHNRKIKTTPSLSGLADFDPKSDYKIRDKDIKPMDDDLKQTKMGDVSNLITDMTIKGASSDEIARAVRHSMVVIDAVKHKLDWRQSYIDHDIAALKERYQGGKNAGASTIVSLAKSPDTVPHRKPGVFVTDPITGKKKKIYVDPETGRKLYTPTGETYEKTDPKTGIVTTVSRVTKTKKMYEREDAGELSSGTAMEQLYVNHANSLKALANQARKESLGTKHIEYSPSARETYRAEYESLSKKLILAQRNAPKERKAQLAANAAIAAKKKANPDLDKESVKSLKYRELERARIKFKASKPTITITDKEWAAIQAGAIAPSRLKSILRAADSKALKERVLPRQKPLMSNEKRLRANSMRAKGLTDGEIALALGVSLSTLYRAFDD